MNTLIIMMIAFGVISLSIASFNFYIFARSKERFIQSWGLSWMCYSCSLLFLILGINEPQTIFLELRKVFDMFNILFLLFGVYAFQNQRIPGYWTRFSLYLMLWALLSAVYNFDLMSLYIPISMFQLGATIMIVYLVIKTWIMPGMEKFSALIGFSLWGIGKAVISLIEASGAENMYSFYLAEIIFFSVLNFIAFIIYLQRAESNLGIARKHFKLIVENALDVIFFYQINTSTFTYITPSVEKVLGYTPQEFYSDGKFFKELVDKDDYSKIDNIFNFDLDVLSKGNAENTTVIKMYLKNSQQIWAEITTTTVFENNIPIALEGMIRDVTATKNAEEEMISSKKSREIFFSYISHELKTPVTSILAYVTALRDETLTEDAKREEALDIIYKKTLILNRLVLDVSQLSKLEAKQFSFSFMVMDCLVLINELVENHYHDFKREGLKLNLKINDAALKNLSVIADSARIEQVFNNIIVNAIRFSKKGGLIKINFRIDSKKENLEFSVRDFGRGITEEELPYIFERFFQANGGQDIQLREETSGLGMTIAKEIIEAHGGTISAKSKINKGSIFIVTLPLYFE